tara:strand:+ start:2462 stop:2776 length:315 start_codon:yes stop_codon:yes gene_type:complete
MVKTAILQHKNNENAISVHTKVWASETGTKSLRQTKENLLKEYPDFTFDGWVYDLNDPEHASSLKMYFLSPNVQLKKIWAITDNGFEQIVIDRNLRKSYFLRRL